MNHKHEGRNLFAIHIMDNIEASYPKKKSEVTGPLIEKKEDEPVPKSSVKQRPDVKVKPKIYIQCLIQCHASKLVMIIYLYMFIQLTYYCLYGRFPNITCHYIYVYTIDI